MTDENKLKEQLFALVEQIGDERLHIDAVVHLIDDAPAVDAVPVRHGHWKPYDLTYGRNLYACSVCGDVSDVATVMGDVVYQFCPHCGARMDGNHETD